MFHRSVSTSARQIFLLQRRRSGILSFAHNRRTFRAGSIANRKDDGKNSETEQLSTIPSTKNSTTNTTNTWTDRLHHDAAVGCGQVIFLNSRESGGLMLASLALLGDPYLASLATLGTLTSSATAKMLHLDEGTRHAGLWSYHGCLVGCATAAVVAPSSIPLGLATTVGGAAAATGLSAALSKSITNMPQWTWSFNIVTLSILLARSGSGSGSSSSSSVGDVAAAAVDVSAETAAAAEPVTSSLLLLAPWHGLSQIFVVESAWTGLGIAAAIYSYSPQLARHALWGSTVGALTGLAICGADGSAVAAGLWSYNSALVSMGVGVFFTESQQSPSNYTLPSPTWLLSTAGAVGGAVSFGALSTLCGIYSMPCLTLPFCATMSACYNLHTVIPSLQLADDPHSPERNRYRKV